MRHLRVLLIVLALGASVHPASAKTFDEDELQATATSDGRPASITPEAWAKLTPAERNAASQAERAKAAAASKEELAVARQALAEAEKKVAEAKKGLDAIDTSATGRFGLGVGIGVSRLGVNGDILATQVINKVLRVTDIENVRRDVWFETHYLLDRFASGEYSSHGPFFGVQAGVNDSVFNSVAFGYMFSLKRTPRRDRTNKAAFNFGVGVFTTKVSRLADGYAENEPLPEGAESVLLRRQAKSGFMALFSFSVY